MKFFPWISAAIGCISVREVCSFSNSGSHHQPFIAYRNKVTQLRATWSDSRAVKEYQDFLSTGLQQIKREKDSASVIVKSADFDPELPDGLFKMGMGDDIVLIAGEELPAMVGGTESYPIYITLPPTELREFLKNLPESFVSRRDDFVFCSGGRRYGNIEQVLKDFGLARDTMTQFLITGIQFTAFRPQDRSVQLGFDAGGTEKWAGECSACGKWQGAIADRLERNAIRCNTHFYREWRRLMWENIMLESCFNLVGAIREDATSVKDVGMYYGEEVSDMMWTISGLLRGGRAITLTYGFEERMFGVADTMDEQCTLIDDMYPYLYEAFENVPAFQEYMCYAQDMRGLLLTANVPRRGYSDEKKPIIRSGNLRADGVI